MVGCDGFFCFDDDRPFFRGRGVTLPLLLYFLIHGKDVALSGRGPLGMIGFVDLVVSFWLLPGFVGGVGLAVGSRSHLVYCDDVLGDCDSLAWRGYD